MNRSVFLLVELWKYLVIVNVDKVICNWVFGGLFIWLNIM